MNAKQILLPKAVFIADSHYRAQDFGMDCALLEVLDSFIASPPPQVFLMGDIADLFIGHIPSSANFNRYLIDKIDTLSQKCEVFYFEGNHDFGIDCALLPRVKIYPRIMQPALFNFESKIYALAHGDIFIDKGYEMYIRTMNSAFILSAFRLLDLLSFGRIYRFANAKVNAKKIKHLDFAKCNEGGFYDFAKSRAIKYVKSIKKSSIADISGINGIIEGHFHIGQQMKVEIDTSNISNGRINNIDYISLPSFYCDKRFFTLL